MSEDRFNELRRKAESLVGKRASPSGEEISEDVSRLIHELQVHQTELEVQNEELKQAQQALEESRDRYADLYDFAPVGYVTLDGKGCIAEINLTGCTLLKRERAAIIGSPLASHVHAVDRKGFRAHLGRCRKDAQEESSSIGRTIEMRLAPRRGEAIHVQLSTVPIVCAGELRIRAAITDITPRKQAESELQRTNLSLRRAMTELKDAQEQMLQQERLHAMGLKASGIAHDFNNRLAVILGLSDLLKKKLAGLDIDPSLVGFLEMICSETVDAAEVVSRLVDFYRSRRAEDKFRLVNLNDLVKHVIAQTKPRWKNEMLATGVHVEIELDLRPIPPVEGNPSEIGTTLTNLIFNAIDAMPEGGMVTFRTRSEGDHVVIEVTDTGDGMSEEVRKRCLEPFYSTKGTHGTGMGLATTFGVVDRHGGVIEAGSRPGKGSTFAIRLPASGKTFVEEKVIPPSAMPADALHSLHILVVDDEPNVRLVLSELLEIAGHTFETAGDGQEAWAKFSQVEFDIVLSDIGMPRMTGAELASRVKSESPATPVILLTGYTDIGRDAVATSVEADLVLMKPVDRQRLLEAIAQVFRPTDR